MQDNKHNHSGCCGQHNHEHNHTHHEHSHGGGCCGHHHHHNHGHNHEGCNGDHDHEPVEIILSPIQQDILFRFAEISYLPLAKFVMKSSKSEHFEADALSPVYIDGDDLSMDEVKEIGLELNKLEDFGLITLDYDIPLEDYEYSEFYNSGVYKFFEQTMKESAEQEGFVFDTSDMEKGSIALTDMGAYVLEQLCADFDEIEEEEAVAE